MPTTVRLQYNFHTGLMPVIFAIILIIFCIVMIIIAEKKAKGKRTPKVEMPKQEMTPIPTDMRFKYLHNLRKIQEDVGNEKMDVKSGYQILSLTIREFVKEYTGVDVTKKTLAEIRGLDIPKLERIIEECYEHEFSEKPSGDFDNTVSKTIKVIESWN